MRLLGPAGVRVQDGNSITVLHDGKSEKIRLYGVDAPEGRQDFGHRARQFTAALVCDKTLEVTPVTKDRYGRTVAWVTVNRVKVNQELVRAGMAWWFSKYARHDRDLAQLEQEAREAKRGLWAMPDPVPPWDYRQTKKKRLPK